MLANSISVANVFPYGPLMVQHLGMTDDRRELGFFAGFLMTSYMVGSMLSSYHLGMLCDRWGRKKVILLGLLAQTLPQLLFGLSEDFTFACAMRFAMGFPNGIVIAGKVMAPELVDARDQGLVMSLIAGMWGMHRSRSPNSPILGLQATQHMLPTSSSLRGGTHTLPSSLCGGTQQTQHMLPSSYVVALTHALWLT